jgi:hypothetical protein
MESAGRRRTLPPPLASLSLGGYLRSSPSNCLPFALTLQAHALEHPLRYCRRLCSSTAAVSSPPPVKDNPLRPSFFLFWFAKGSPSLSCRRFTIRAYPEPIRGLPERRLIRRRRRSSLPSRFLRLQSHPALLHSVRNCARSFLFPLGLHHRMCDLAGANVPPPSGDGRRRGTGVPIDSSVTCANALVTRRAHPRTIWCTAG